MTGVEFLAAAKAVKPQAERKQAETALAMPGDRERCLGPMPPTTCPNPRSWNSCANASKRCSGARRSNKAPRRPYGFTGQ
jgi:hypothetical protein